LLQQLSELSDEEKTQAVGLIKQYGDVFSEHEFDLGCTPLLQHHIDTETPDRFVKVFDVTHKCTSMSSTKESKACCRLTS